MRFRQLPSEVAAPDDLVLRDVQQKQIFTLGFTVLLPPLGLLVGDPSARYVTVLLALLVVFVALHLLAVGLVKGPPDGPWKGVLAWTLVVLALTAVTLAAIDTEHPWFWLILPCTAVSDAIVLRPRRTLVAQAVIISLAVAICLYLAVVPQLGPETALYQAALSFFVVVFVGHAEATGPDLWRRTVDAERSSKRLAVAEERLRISEDLHDILGRALEVVAFKGELASRLVRSEPERAEHELDELSAVARGAVREVRELIRARRNTHIVDEVSTARQLLRSASITTEISGEFHAVPDELANTLGRVAREGITNMLRHSRATHCEIRIDQGTESVELLIRNDGLPTAPESEARPAADERSGVDSLRRHVSAHGGRLTAEADGAFFTLTARLPMPASRDGGAPRV